jgi:transcriptional regulator with XRE-family HTH domain
MLSADVTTLRERLLLTRDQFASLLGVSPSTVYRWEAADGNLSVDPMQRWILAALQDRMEKPGGADRIEREVCRALVIRGGLYALYKLLAMVFDNPGSRRLG